MDCTQIHSRMHGFLDGELDPVTAAAIEEHVRSCRECEKVLRGHSALRRALREWAPYHRAPEDLANRIRSEARKLAGDIPARAVSRWFNWRPLQFGATMAATAVVTWIAAVQFIGLSAVDLAEMQVISGHSRSMITGRLADVASSDRHTVKPWLSSKLDFSPPVTDLTTSGFPLVGGRIDYVENRPVAVLVYRHRQHMIDLFVWPKGGLERSVPTGMASKSGYHLLHWAEGGMTFWAISDLNPKELQEFATAYAAVQ